MGFFIRVGCGRLPVQLDEEARFDPKPADGVCQRVRRSDAKHLATQRRGARAEGISAMLSQKVPPPGPESECICHHQLSADGNFEWTARGHVLSGRERLPARTRTRRNLLFSLAQGGFSKVTGGRAAVNSLNAAAGFEGRRGGREGGVGEASGPGGHRGRSQEAEGSR